MFESNIIANFWLDTLVSSIKALPACCKRGCPQTLLPQADFVLPPDHLCRPMWRLLHIFPQGMLVPHPFCIGSEDVFQYCACLSRVQNIGYHSRNYYGEGVESAWAFSIVESLLLVPTGVLKGGFVHPLDPHAGSALLHLKHMSVKICACLIHCCLDIMWWWLSCWKKGKESISKRVLCHARDQISCQGTCSTMSKTVSWLCLILDCQVLDPIFVLCSASHIEGGRLKSLKDEIECNEELFILVSWEWLLWISIELLRN